MEKINFFKVRTDAWYQITVDKRSFNIKFINQDQKQAKGYTSCGKQVYMDKKSKQVHIQ